MPVGVSRIAEILVIEGDSSELRRLCSAFERLAVPCRVLAKDAGAALAELRSTAIFPDVIITGWSPEVVSNIKTNPLLRAIPVVVFANTMSDEDVIAAYDARANCVVLRPADDGGAAQMASSIAAFWLRTAVRPAQFPRGRDPGRAAGA